jgi:hypothetical protein
MFQLAAVDWATSRLHFSRGGWQDARGGNIGGAGGRGHAQDYFLGAQFITRASSLSRYLARFD